MDKVQIALIGGGNRGKNLTRLLVDSDRPVVVAALAEPMEPRLAATGDLFDVAPQRRFTDYRRLLDQCNDLDGAIIATDVNTHAEIALACIGAGVPIYLEKPMTRTVDEALAVTAAAKQANVPVMIGFNLRYAPFFHRLRQLVADGAVGDVVSIEWKEVLSAAAWAIGYCRATWYSREAQVGGWLLEKSCHDIDQINWLAGAPGTRVASFGSRSHFLPREDVPLRCTDGCPIEAQCDYSSYKLKSFVADGMPDYVPPDREDLCVYHSGSDLMDRQVAIIEYENNVTAAFSIVATGPDWSRLMRVCGTKATIRGSDLTNELEICRHDKSEPIVETVDADKEHHGGADPTIIASFIDFIADPVANAPRATLDDGLESMLVAGGIETARRENRVIELGQWRQVD